jgi:hypothetical protein
LSPIIRPLTSITPTSDELTNSFWAIAPLADATGPSPGLSKSWTSRPKQSRCPSGSSTQIRTWEESSVRILPRRGVAATVAQRDARSKPSFLDARRARFGLLPSRPQLDSCRSGRFPARFRPKLPFTGALPARGGPLFRPGTRNRGPDRQGRSQERRSSRSGELTRWAAPRGRVAGWFGRQTDRSGDAFCFQNRKPAPWSPLGPPAWIAG